MTFCTNCGQQLNDGAAFCTNCGQQLGGANPQPQQFQAQPQQQYNQYQQNAGAYNNMGGMPVAQLKTDYSAAKYILLSLVTCGIYGLIQTANIADDVDTVTTRYDNKKLMNFWLVYLLLAPVTCGIFAIVWNHQLADKVGNELKRRGLGIDFGAKTYWLWNVLGSLILVGPIIYLVKLIDAVNALNADFNMRG